MYRNPNRSSRPAFSLIELLVVIAIVGITVSLLLPSLGRARSAAKAVVELGALQQVMAGYAAYSGDHKGAVLPGYIPATWVSENPPPGTPAWEVFDDQGERIYGVRAQRYPWRLIPYLDSNMGALYKDANLLSRYRAREDYQYVVSVSPSFGLNADFVGGKALPGFGFNPTALRQWGPFYITRLDQARRPDHLLVFASAHGVNPDAGAPVDGYFEVSSPYFLDRRWTASYSTDDPPGVHGNLHARHGKKAVIGAIDGHGQLASPTELEDMRWWSNGATRPDWTLGTR